MAHPSDSSTFRQKAQRAFGAELLMPVDLITEHTGGNYTQANVKKVAAEFEVSPVLAATQLANHKLISPAEVELYSYASDGKDKAVCRKNLILQFCLVDRSILQILSAKSPYLKQGGEYSL